MYPVLWFPIWRLYETDQDVRAFLVLIAWSDHQHRWHMAMAGRGARELTFGQSRDKLLKLLNSCGLGLTELDQRGSNAVPLGTPFR